MNDGDEEVQYTVKMPRRLREDAHRETERGELSTDVRDLFRRKAYGTAGSKESTELERKQAELEKTRERQDDLRRKRRRIDAELESQQTRETRLEEQIQRLQEQQDERSGTIETLESMLQNGERMYDARVRNAIEGTGLDVQIVIEELQERNPDVPDCAFRLSEPHEPLDWRDQT